MFGCLWDRLERFQGFVQSALVELQGSLRRSCVNYLLAYFSTFVCHIFVSDCMIYLRLSFLRHYEDVDKLFRFFVHAGRD